MFGHSRAKRIPPMGRKFTLPHSLSEKVEEAVETVPSRHLPLSCPSGVEEKVQEDPRKKMEDLVETKGQNGGNRVPHNVGDIPFKCPLETGGLLSSLQCSPAPLDLHPNPPEDGLRENTQKSLMNCCPEGHIVTSSHGPAGSVVPDTDAAVLSDPTPCCPLLQETSTKEVLGENHQPVGDTSYLSRKEIQANEPSGISSRSSFSPVSASRIISQPTTGHHNGQQPDNSHLLGTPVASTPAMDPTALVAQLPRDNTVKAERKLAPHDRDTSMEKKQVSGHMRGSPLSLSSRGPPSKIQVME
ncbi:putative UPF0607 protein FLJ37424 [Neofelis nebulosa]|uniref:putative UPF0607 protein FLJ37424 n=1 Tax=Neofelis nebulosa TaxID=61452 RepID=UPI00272B7142|nr:putative UPF0607 protein FLJ37424 [Neofelis nebulosa]